MRTLLLLFLSCWMTLAAQAQNLTEGPKGIFAKTITAEKIRRHVMVLAADGMEGRETGQPGQRKAAEYLVSQLKQMGIPSHHDSYRQSFYFYREKQTVKSLTVKGQSLIDTINFWAPIASNSGTTNIEASEVVFLGYGIDDTEYSDYNGRDVRGKVIMVFDGEPIHPSGKVLLSNNTSLSDWSRIPELKYQAAFNHGAKAILLIKDLAPMTFPQPNKGWKMGKGLQPEGKMAPNAFISPATAEKIVGRKYNKIKKARRKINAKGLSKNLSLPTKLSLKLDINREYLEGENVLGFIEGSDPTLKDEYVFVTAHYDHLGKRGDVIFNGADDNGSGCSGLLSMARAFAQAKKAGIGPKRTIVFMWVAGEEKGLLGSRYYVEHPIYSLANTVADINIDMIGRDDDQFHEVDSVEYVYVIGADRLSTDLQDIVTMNNMKYSHLFLDYAYNKDDDPNRFYYRSDHYNFAKNNIPSVFFFSGTHEDYHRPSDTVEKLDYEKIAAISRLAFYTTWDIAHRQKRLRVNVKGRN